MLIQVSQTYFKIILMAMTLVFGIDPTSGNSQETQKISISNFSMPGIIDLPSARRFPDGELIVTHQNHKYLFMTGISFQAMPRLGVTFRYGGQGRGGHLAQDRVNWDRSFDAHINILDEKKYWPAIAVGLRDFIGTGWYSSEYIVGTKVLGNLEFSAGLGFGRLSGRNSFSNPFGNISSFFAERGDNNHGRGGTISAINWFQGNVSAFYGLNYHVTKNTVLSLEYSPDIMLRESRYSEIESPWNLGASYQINDYVDLSLQYLQGNQISLTAHVAINPNEPPLPGGKELAPVPMRLRGDLNLPVSQSNPTMIKTVLEADKFKIHSLSFSEDTVSLSVTNTKFRSIAQAVGRLASTLQRFTADEIKFAELHFYSGDLNTASYIVNLNGITFEQFNPLSAKNSEPSIEAIDVDPLPPIDVEKRFKWGVGPYLAHRLFNPDLPLSVETGIEAQAGYQVLPGLQLSGAVRKSVLTNLTDNKRRSNSDLPRVHSDWPLYDINGQKGHIHSFTASYIKNLAPGLYGRVHAGLLEPFFAGFGGEILYKKGKSPLSFGLDLHRVRKRDYDMRFDLLDYETTIGHLSIYYEAGGIFDVEINAGRYLAGDWGATTTISRKFGSGWEVGGYATFTDVPFHTFGEGSFDKAIYVSVPIDWIISSPNQKKRRLTLRPITRDGGAHMASARKLFNLIKRSQNADFKREFGRLWK